ncbi:MAG TPA: tRNA pseudouridine(55) synthase TruB [Prolixibacteraceae bacterium]|nr:MAG: tRNA pseudouridine(55) synthase TruB [Bacteroidetes bacterium GWB2_41_8]HCY43718.1 tRNA pseudouridine(55) synthase TruB [Prolixibacteraceae bacterium]
MEKSFEEFDFQKGEILLFDKELDWTSFDLVRKLRNFLCRATGVKKLKVGHAGTLDPKATGLMIVCTGKETKNIDLIQAKEKEYVATIKLGATTPSFDLETAEDATFPTDHLTLEFIESTLKNFKGEIDQVPPIFSAVKIEGKRAYEHARKGNDIVLQPKKITISELEVLNFSNDQIVLRIVCSKGTYIRSLARDLGIALNSGAYLVGLCRTRIGDLKLEDAWDLKKFLEKLTPNETN